MTRRVVKSPETPTPASNAPSKPLSAERTRIVPVGAPASAPPPGGTWTPAPNAPPYAMQPPVITERPTAAVVLAIIGGIFILLGGLAEIALGAFAASFTFGLFGGTLIAFGAVGALLGILIVVFAILLSIHPQQHTLYGVLILVFSIISLSSFFGGFVLGFILALIGGILALTFKPTAPVVWQQPVQRVCPKCGRVVDPNVKFCPACGNSLS